MALQFKIGVELRVTEAVNKILLKVEPCFTWFAVPCVVTSGTDGQHGKYSKHYVGQALDFRTRDIKLELRPTLVKMVKEALGQDFDVVLESDHLHVEYDPKDK